ncbi:MAG: alpha/beta hydrolase [Solirubrobacteraceae bacterium]|nr:alpha/beta hydrolase [Solirubrobacteraceae bacterium]
MSPALSRLGGALLAVAATVLVAGCTVPAPEGAAPLRYRDLIYTESVTKNVTYGQAALADGTQQTLTMDIYQPTGETEKYRPVIIWAHGGSFAVGSSTSGDVVTLATRAARRGYVSASINYRLLAKGVTCAGANYPDVCVNAAFAASDDLKAAVRYFRAHAEELRIDPDAIIVGGTSAGAIAAVLTAATPNSAGASGNPGFPQKVNAAISISGGSPTNLIFGKGDAPILFWHGTADNVVPYSWATSNVEAMTDKNLIAILRNVQGAGHVPFSQYGDDMDEQARNFAYRVLGL